MNVPQFVYQVSCLLWMTLFTLFLLIKSTHWLIIRPTYLQYQYLIGSKMVAKNALEKINFLQLNLPMRILWKTKSYKLIFYKEISIMK